MKIGCVSWCFHSFAGGTNPEEAIDTIGELGLLYRLAPIVFMGGSLVRRGGQNPIEAAKLGAAIVHGPHVSNFTEIYAALEAHHPVVVWVETGWMNPGSLRGTWTSWDGSRINYSLIEHTVTLSGVSPTQVRVNDPWKAGSQYWYSKAAFQASWADFDNMAVILQ